MVALRKGEAVRLPMGGVCVLEGGFEGRLIVGLSQEAKKSSPDSEGPEDSFAGVDTTTSLTTTSSGNLRKFVSQNRTHELDAAYSAASAAARFFSSSLYLVAALDVYFVLGSLLASAALPP